MCEQIIWKAEELLENSTPLRTTPISHSDEDHVEHDASTVSLTDTSSATTVGVLLPNNDDDVDTTIRSDNESMFDTMYFEHLDKDPLKHNNECVSSTAPRNLEILKQAIDAYVVQQNNQQNGNYSKQRTPIVLQSKDVDEVTADWFGHMPSELKKFKGIHLRSRRITGLLYRTQLCLKYFKILRTTYKKRQ